MLMDVLIGLVVLVIVVAIVYAIINAVPLPEPFKRVAWLVLLLIALVGLIYVVRPLLSGALGT